MQRHMTGIARLRTITFAALATLGAGTALAADPDPIYSGWLGREITITASSFNDHIPTGGKLTFVHDAEDNVVRVCTRTGSVQRGSWRNDMVPGCSVALSFTAGTRYCTVEDVKAGNAEVLSSCHRLRSRDVAMHPAATARGALELHDVIVFLIKGAEGKHVVSILVDSPSRVTAGGIATGQD